MKKTIILLLCSVLLSSAAFADEPPAKAKTEITVAAASDLRFAMEEIVAAFQKRNPDVAVKVSYGSSGNFFAQLNNRAPFDIFFSADVSYPKKLEEAGLTLKDSLFEYAVGRIVLWAPKTSKVDMSKGIEFLRDTAVRKIAIANPAHAPYGRAAEAALKHYKVYDDVKERLVLGDNISQTAQFVQSGAADVGIIALSLALAPQMKEAGNYWMIPQEAYPPLKQGVAILSWTKNPDVARAFCDFAHGEDGRAILKRFGFSMPEGK